MVDEPSTLKVKLIYWPATTFAARAEAQAALFRYIDGWQKPRRPTNTRPHGKPGSVNPLGYPQRKDAEKPR